MSILRNEDFKDRFLGLISKSKKKKRKYAKDCGISVDIIYDAENYDRVPSTNILIKIADYEEISVAYLMCFTDDIAFKPALKRTTFTERFLNLVSEDGRKIYTISKEAGVNPSYVYNFETRKTLPNIDIVFALANELSCSVDYLLGRTDIK